MKKLYVSMFILIAYTSQAQNVGIGTTTPNYPLTVVSNGIYQGIIQKSGTTEIGFYAAPGAALPGLGSALRRAAYQSEIQTSSGQTPPLPRAE